MDKVEFIVMGGTFMALPEDYRDYFIRNLHDALSGHTSNNVAEAVRYERVRVSDRIGPLSVSAITPDYKEFNATRGHYVLSIMEQCWLSEYRGEIWIHVWIWSWIILTSFMSH